MTESEYAIEREHEYQTRLGIISVDDFPKRRMMGA